MRFLVLLRTVLKVRDFKIDDCPKIGCLNIDGTNLTVYNSTNNNLVFFFVFEFVNSIL